MKSKNLKTMLLSAVLCTVAWGGGFVNMAVLSVGADEAAATQTVATSDKIVAPAVTVPTQTYLTWEETGINREAILASAPESLGEKYENGVFSMPDWGLTGVEVMLFASSSSYDLTLTDGVWSVSLDLTAEQVAEGYHLFLDTASCSYDYHWNYMTSSYELENVHGSNYKITVGKNDKSAYGYQKDDLNVWTYYNNKTGALAYQDVENIKTKDIAYYEVDGTLYEVSVYVDHWYHYFPETGWSDGVVPTGYEGKEAAWFKTECPCQIPGVLGSGDGDNVGGGENGGNGDNVGGGENGGNGDNVDGGENGGNGDNIDGGENGGNGDNVDGGENGGNGDNIDGGENGGNGDNVGGGENGGNGDNVDGGENVDNGENGGKENEKDNSPTSSIEETVDSGNVSNDSSSDASEPKGLSKGARIGIIIAIIVAVSIGGFAIYWFGIRKKDFDDLLDLFKN